MIPKEVVAGFFVLTTLGPLIWMLFREWLFEYGVKPPAPGSFIRAEIAARKKEIAEIDAEINATFSLDSATKIVALRKRRANAEQRLARLELQLERFTGSKKRPSEWSSMEEV